MIANDMATRVSSPIFIGRRAEVMTLDDALDRAERGDPSLVLIAGEAGIGKSRLIAETAGRVRDRGGLVLEGGSVALGADEGLPYAPVAEALRGLVRQLDPGAMTGLIDPATVELARLVPELLTGAATASPASSPEWAQTRLFEGFLTLLSRVGERHPVLLVIEDLHWADRSTRDLLAFVVRHLRSERALIVGTYRSDELHRRHPLRPWLAEIQRLPRVEQIDLARFDRDELAEQLAAIEGEAPTVGLVDLIGRRSEGNPFFAEELLATRALGETDHLPAKLRDVLVARLATLPPPARRLLEVASVAGGAVDHELLAQVSGLGGDMLTQALEELISSHLLVPSGDLWMPAYAFRHALLAEAVYDELLAAERRRFHGAYAAAIQSREVPKGAAGATQLAGLAYHARSSRDLALALRTEIAAARASFRASAVAEAAQAFDRAIELWEALPETQRPTDEDYVELLYEASGVLMWANSPRPASEMARRAIENLDGDADPVRVARLTERLAWAVYLAGDLPTAIRLLEDSVGSLAAMPPSREKALATTALAQLMLYAGEYRKSIPIAEEAIAATRAYGGLELEAQTVLGSALAIIGECDRGLGVLRDALVRAHASGDSSAIASVYLTLTSTLQDCDLLEEAARVGLEGGDWARAVRLRGFGSIAAEPLIAIGRWSEARSILDDSFVPGEQGTSHLWNAVWIGLLGIRTGSLDAIDLLLEAENDGAELLRDAAFAGNLTGGLLELTLSERRLEDGRAIADRALGWLADAEDVRFRSRVVRLALEIEADLAESARGRRDIERESEARSIGRARLDTLHGLMAQFANDASPVFGEARGNLMLAEAEMTRLLDSPDPAAWAVAERHFRAPRRPFELASTLRRKAEAVLAARGPRSDAARALSEAWSICSEIGAAPLRRSVEELARAARIEIEATSSQAARAAERSAPDQLGLTNREREVLALLAAGYTNRRIAESLFISESTAGVHVSNILGKLGVSNRVEAAAMAVRLSLAR
jgi:DNA-binding CsgD family transcriptional regulator